MAGLNQNFRKVFVVSNNTLLTSGTTTALAPGQLGIFNADTYAATTTPNWSTAKSIIIAQGTPDQGDIPKGAGIRNETDKSEAIAGKKITAWRKTLNQAGQQNIVAIGYDGVDNTKTISGKCDEVKHIYIRLTGKPIDVLFPTPGGYTLHLEAQGPCCSTCEDSCADVDPEYFADQFLENFNQSTFLGGIKMSTFVTAQKVVTGSGDTKRAGIIFTGAFVEPVTSLCYFDQFPFNSDPVHIQLSEFNPDWHGDRCASTYPVTVLQEVEYVQGSGEQVIRQEAYAHGWDMRYYYKWGVFARNAEGQYLFTDPTKSYIKYTLVFDYDYPVLGWSDRYNDRYDLEIFIDSTQSAYITAFETALNGYINSVTGLGVAPVV